MPERGGREQTDFNKDNDYVIQERYQLKRKIKLKKAGHMLCSVQWMWLATISNTKSPPW